MTTARTTVVLELTAKEAQFLASLLVNGVEWDHGAGNIAEGIYMTLADDAGIVDEGFEFNVSGGWLQADAA